MDEQSLAAQGANDWDAARYLKFAHSRTQPVRDLVARVTCSPRTVLDVGCGPGNSTAVLAARFPAAHLTGIDSSPAMLAQARQTHPGLAFLHVTLTPDCPEIAGNYDLVFSNACLQWIPDHATLIPALWRHVAPGGTLAFQIPLTDQMPISPILDDLGRSAPWRTYLAGVHDLGTLAQDEYFDLARGLTKDWSLWRTDYAVPVAGVAGLVDWYMGSRLRPFVAALPADLRDAFLAEVQSRFARVCTPRADGIVLMWFPRLFAVLNKPS